MSEIPQYRDAIRGALPPHFGPQARSFVRDGVAWLYDFDRAIFFNAEMARYPSTAPTDAYSLLAKDRRIRIGPSESQDAIVSHLRNWITFWQLAGLPMGLMLAVQAYLAPSYPRIRLISRKGLWHKLEEGATGRMLELPGYDPLLVGFTVKTSPRERLRASGLYTRAKYPGLFDYDSVSHPSYSARLHHYWMVIYPGALPKQTPYDTGDWVYNEKKSSWGFSYPHGDIAVLRTIIREFSPANTRCVAVMVVPSMSDFDPAAPVGFPDGTWGNEIKYEGSSAVWARRADIRYLFTNPNE